MAVASEKFPSIVRGSPLEVVYLGETNDIGGEGCTNIPLGLRGLMQESSLQRNQAVGS